MGELGLREARGEAGLAYSSAHVTPAHLARHCVIIARVIWFRQTGYNRASASDPCLAVR